MQSECVSTKWRGLQIYFPCQWVPHKVAHLDNGESGWMKNPGRLANRLHESFDKQMGRSTQGDFIAAHSIGAILSQVFVNEGSSGFHSRNVAVASSQYLIALTYGNNIDEYRGGTAHTWNLCQGKKIHISLDTL